MQAGAIATAAVALIAAAPAGAVPCPASRPAITVELDIAEPAIDNALPQAALQKLAGRQRLYGRTQGLYQADLEVGWRARVKSREVEGETCRWIDQVTVTLTMAKRVIHIAHERAPGGCPYESVLAHERKHQAADEAVLRDYRPRLQRAVEETAATLPRGPMRASDGEVAEARLTQPIAEALKRGFAALAKTRAERQAEIDTPAEYRRVRAQCG